MELSGLAHGLVQNGFLLESEAAALQLQAHSDKVSFVNLLVQNKKMKARDVAEFSARSFGFPLLDLAAVDADQLPHDVLDAKIIQGKRLLPLKKRGNHLFLAVADLSNLQVLDDVRFKTGLVVEPVVVEDDKLSALIEHVADQPDDANWAQELADDDIDLEYADDEAAAQKDDKAGSEVDDAPVVRFLQKILLDAIYSGVSDIHFEPYEKSYRIRYRLDGVLTEAHQPPIAIKDKLSSRIKVVSKLDISEKRIPQDGRMKVILSKNRAVDIRVSTLPTLYGEKIVMRINDSSGVMQGIDALGYEPEQKEALINAVKRPYGMVLITGPTGSGKTVSLYSCINILNQPGVNISTAEDPAEINLPGINQVNVNEKVGLTFASALKSFLRQDPDVIMVGEIRDLETADIAIKAAQTGHMVLSTLHTNDAPSTLTRLVNMGVAPFNIASAILLISAQRLARRLCKCKVPVEIPREALLRAGFCEEDLDGSWKPFHPKGCELCKGTGYKGRVGVYQVMPISDEMSRIIMKNGTTHDIADQAQREGIRNLRQSGLLKVKAGLTSLEEVESITN
jgi:type IV pilus assembly protein PilB